MSDSYRRRSGRSHQPRRAFRGTPSLSYQFYRPHNPKSIPNFPLVGGGYGLTPQPFRSVATTSSWSRSVGAP